MNNHVVAIVIEAVIKHLSGRHSQATHGHDQSGSAGGGKEVDDKIGSGFLSQSSIRRVGQKRTTNDIRVRDSSKSLQLGLKVANLFNNYSGTYFRQKSFRDKSSPAVFRAEVNSHDGRKWFLRSAATGVGIVANSVIPGKIGSTITYSFSSADEFVAFTGTK